MSLFIRLLIPAMLRHLLTAAGGALTATGILTATEIATLVGALSTIGGVAWSAYERRSKSALPLPSNGTPPNGP